MKRRFAVVFKNTPEHPIFIDASTFEEFAGTLRVLCQKYGEFFLIYDVF